eukprot:325353-Amphidinium_carterae.1
MMDDKGMSASESSKKICFLERICSPRLPVLSQKVAKLQLNCLVAEGGKAGRLAGVLQEFRLAHAFNLNLLKSIQQLRQKSSGLSCLLWLLVKRSMTMLHII